MNIITQKVPLTFTHLPAFIDFHNKNNEKFLSYVITALRQRGNSKPASSNASYAQIADDFTEFHDSDLEFKFYASKNIFVGHNVISHATNEYIINYNTRFHSVKTFTIEQWLGNFWHECTHLADQTSFFTYDHRNQRDWASAPFVVSDLSQEIYRKFKSEWV